MEPTIDAMGEMIRPQFHDGLLFGVIRKDDDVLIHARTRRGETFVLTLHRIEAFQCDGFQGHNTITDLFVYFGPTEADPRSELVLIAELLAGAPHPSAGDKYKQEYQDRVSKILDRVDRRELTAMALITAETCTIDALCSHVTVEKLN